LYIIVTIDKVKPLMYTTMGKDDSIQKRE